MYDMNWVEACRGDSWLVDTVGCVETCEGDSLYSLIVTRMHCARGAADLSRLRNASARR